MAAMRGRLVTVTLDAWDDERREVTAYVPAEPPEAVVYAGDGQLLASWGADLESGVAVPTVVVGVHRSADETLRLHEYSPGFDPVRFAAHEQFVTETVRRWAEERLDLHLHADRTALLGVSAGGELALALGLRHPDLYGVVLCASPGAGFRPPTVMPGALPRTYLLAGTDEPFFAENARRWSTALQAAGAEVVAVERPGSHGGRFWRRELPQMLTWAFGRVRPIA